MIGVYLYFNPRHKFKFNINLQIKNNPQSSHLESFWEMTIYLGHLPVNGQNSSITSLACEAQLHPHFPAQALHPDSRKQTAICAFVLNGLH